MERKKGNESHEDDKENYFAALDLGERQSTFIKERTAKTKDETGFDIKKDLWRDLQLERGGFVK